LRVGKAPWLSCDFDSGQGACAIGVLGANSPIAGVLLEVLRRGRGCVSLEPLPAAHPDVLIIVVRGAKDIDLIRQLGQEQRVPVMFCVLLPEADRALGSLALLAGADDFLVWPFDPKEFFSRLSARTRHLPPKVHTTLNPGDPLLASMLAKLRRAEARLLQYLADRRGEWVSSMDVARDVFSANPMQGGGIVRVHVHALRRKLGPLGMSLVSERTRGYKFLGWKEASE